MYLLYVSLFGIAYLNYNLGQEFFFVYGELLVLYSLMSL